MVNKIKERIKKAGGLKKLLEQVSDEEQKAGFILILIRDNICKISEIPREELRWVFDYAKKGTISTGNGVFFIDDVIDIAERNGFYEKAAQLSEQKACEHGNGFGKDIFYENYLYDTAILFRKAGKLEKASNLFTSLFDEEKRTSGSSLYRLVDKIKGCGMIDLIIEYGIWLEASHESYYRCFLDKGITNLLKFAEKKLSNKKLDNTTRKYYSQLLNHYKEQKNYASVTRIRKRLGKKDDTDIIYSVLSKEQNDK